MLPICQHLPSATMNRCPFSIVIHPLVRLHQVSTNSPLLNEPQQLLEQLIAQVSRRLPTLILLFLSRLSPPFLSLISSYPRCAGSTENSYQLPALHLSNLTSHNRQTYTQTLQLC